MRLNILFDEAESQFLSFVCVVLISSKPPLKSRRLPKGPVVVDIPRREREEDRESDRQIEREKERKTLTHS